MKKYYYVFEEPNFHSEVWKLFTKVCTKKFLFLNYINYKYSLSIFVEMKSLDSETDTDPDPHLAKYLDPNPNQMKEDPKHMYVENIQAYKYCMPD
jgi:hypothetical protein